MKLHEAIIPMLGGKMFRRRSWENDDYWIYSSGKDVGLKVGTAEEQKQSRYAPTPEDLVADDWEEYIPPKQRLIDDINRVLRECMDEEVVLDDEDVYDVLITVLNFL